MNKQYPNVPNTYRFLGGWHNVPRPLWDLSVNGTGYKVEEGKDTVAIKAGKTIVISRSDFEHYFEPLPDYDAEPITTNEDKFETVENGTSDEYPGEPIAMSEPTTLLDDSHYNTEAPESTEFDQMALF